MGGSVYVCVCVCVCEQSTQVSGKKKFIRTSYNMIDELANQSIVNNKIIVTLASRKSASRRSRSRVSVRPAIVFVCL